MVSFSWASYFLIPLTQFYEFFGNLGAVEKSIFESFFDQTLGLLDKSEEYAAFDGRNKLLTFFYTFFEILSANEDYVKLIFNIEQSNYSSLKMLSVLRSSFLQYIKNLGIETINFHSLKTSCLVNRRQMKKRCSPYMMMENELFYSLLKGKKVRAVVS